jgi:hypothetical protein
LDGVAATWITSGSAGVADAVGGAVAVFVAGGVAAAAGAAGALLPDMRYVLKPSLHTSKEQSHGFCGSQGVCCRSQCHSVKHDTTADSAACCAMVIEWHQDCIGPLDGIQAWQASVPWQAVPRTHKCSSEQ